MSNQLSTLQNLNKMISSDFVKQKLNDILGKNAPSFASSLIQVVNQNAMLKEAEPNSIMSAAMMAATLKLPINNNLGFAYIIPFRNNKEKITEAQFQIGYKGFIQLAMRTGEFKHIAVTEVYEGQLIEENPLTGYEFDWSVKPAQDALPVGYVAYFRLLNGFEATNYMSREQVQNHANRYSQSFKRNYGPWKDNFDGMAMKTVLKLLLSKFAPMSIEVHNAIEKDQSVIRDDNVVYNDNVIEADSTANQPELITAEQAEELRGLLAKVGKDEAGMLAYCGVESIEAMTEHQYREMHHRFTANLPKTEEPQPVNDIPQGEEIPL